MPNIKHNIKIICEIHIAYRYIDPSNPHNKEKIDKKSVAPEPTTICFNLFHTVSMHINLHS